MDATEADLVRLNKYEERSLKRKRDGVQVELAGSGNIWNKTECLLLGDDFMYHGGTLLVV